MKGKRLLILGTAFALGLSACAQAAVVVKSNPLKTIDTPATTVYTLSGSEATGGNETPHNSYTAAAETTQNSVSWSVMGNSSMTPWRLGGKNLSSGTDRAIYSTSPLDFNISKVEVTSGSATIAVNYLKITVHSSAADAASGANAVATKTESTEENIVSKTVALDKDGSSDWSGYYYRIVYNVTNSTTSNKYVQFVSATFSVAEVSNIALDKTELTLGIGETYQLEATLPSGVIGTPSWASSNTNAATVSSSGLVTAVGKGTANITATLGSLSTVCAVGVDNFGTESNPLTVEQVKDFIDANNGNETKHILFVKGTVTSSVFVTSTSTYTINIKSEDDEVLQLFRTLFDSSITEDYSSENALLGYEVIAYGFGKKYNGTYELADSLNEPNNPIIVSVTEPAEILLNKTELVLNVDEEEQLEASIPSSVTVTPTWVSSNPSVATVSSDGLIEAVGKGTTTITISAGSLSASCSVSVDNFGTESNPLSVSEAIALIADAPELAAKHIVYVKGVVSSNTEYASSYSNYSDVYLVNDGSEDDRVFELYRVKASSEITNKYSAANSLVGCEVVAYGYGKVHNGTYELATADVAPKNPIIVSVKESEATPEQKINDLSTRAALSYNFEKEQNTTSDVLDNEAVGITGTTYKNWSDLEATSDAVYAGNSAGDHSSIQFRSNNNNSGIVTTTSGGRAAKVTIAWNSNTANGRTVNVYGKNTAYSAASDLYGNNAGTELGSIVNGTSTELIIDGDYSYIGIRSASGALYMDSVTIEWGEPAQYTFSRVALIVGGFISQDLWNELDGENHAILGYGVVAAATSSLNGDTIKNMYDELEGDDAFDILDSDVCDGTTIRNFYTPLTENKTNPAEADETQKTEQQVDVNDTYYVWSLRKNISNYNEAFSAIAYIRLADKLVFFKEVSTTAKQAGQDLIDNGIYTGSDFDGSLGAFLG